MSHDERLRPYGEQPGSVLPTPGRSRNMAAIRRRDTQPEMIIRRLLHAAGLRYRVDQRLDLGRVKPRPDLVFSRAKVAVFVDGCFWHACPDHSKPPAVNGGYWGPKMQGNVDRDRSYDQALVDAGWRVIRIWEHENPAVAARRVIRTVRRS